MGYFGILLLKCYVCFDLNMKFKQIVTDAQQMDPDSMNHIEG